MRIAPDINNPFPTYQGGGQGGNNGGGQGGGNRARFMPGQIGGLANDLQMGYGGNVDKYKNYLKSIYDPVKLGGGFNFSGGNGNGGGKQPTTIGGGNNGGNNGGQGGGFTPSVPRNMAMPGLLNSQAQMPQQMPQNRGLLGDIPPEVLAYISNSMRR